MNSSHSCRHLRAKAMYIAGVDFCQDSPAENPSAGSSHCWCNCTLTETGPDDRPVGAQVCQPSRQCFED